MQKVNIGSIELAALVDTIQSYGAAAVYPEPGDLARFSGFLDGEGRIALNFGCFLVRDGSTILLVDTGWGPEYEGKLLAELAEAGVKPAEVTHVLFTHLHGDHTGWNIDRASGRPNFANARHLVPQADWDHYLSEKPADPGKPWLSSFARDVLPLQTVGLVELISGETTISASLTAIPTPGHTPGHTSVAISSNGERGFVLGDVVISELDAVEPGLQTVFDWDRALAVRTRMATIARLAGEQALVGASHLPAPGLGRFVPAGGAHRWQAI